MKFPAASLFAAVALAVPLEVAAQSNQMAHHDAATAGTSAATMTNGVVRKVDKVAGRVTIAHEALTNLNMPGMTMPFLVKERAWLDSLKEGDRIRFVAQNVNGTLTVVALEAAK